MFERAKTAHTSERAGHCDRQVFNYLQIFQIPEIMVSGKHFCSIFGLNLGRKKSFLASCYEFL
jgi:hypothetical protein